MPTQPNQPASQPATQTLSATHLPPTLSVPPRFLQRCCVSPRETNLAIGRTVAGSRCRGSPVSGSNRSSVCPRVDRVSIGRAAVRSTNANRAHTAPGDTFTLLSGTWVRARAWRLLRWIAHVNCALIYFCVCVRPRGLTRSVAFLLSLLLLRALALHQRSSLDRNG